jgi:hypothetical protein
MLPITPTTKPVGALKLAKVPIPSAKVAAPLPAIVLTDPTGFTLRIRLFVVSAINKFPSTSTAIPLGLLNFATLAAPLTNPTNPLPENDDTVPFGKIFLMRLLAVSATNTVSIAFTATPTGELKLAAGPTPSTNVAVPLPAKVLTVPFGKILRMR